MMIQNKQTIANTDTVSSDKVIRRMDKILDVVSKLGDRLEKLSAEVSYRKNSEKRLSDDTKRAYPASEFVWDRDGHQVIEGSWIPAADFGTRVYDHTSGYVIENGALCNGAPNLILFVFVVSAPLNFEKRRRWRETWDGLTRHRGYDVRMAFTIGRSYRNEINTFIRQENDRHSDIIQLDYLDKYHNLTRKTMTSLDWVRRHCHRAAFVLKTDDDVMLFARKFVNRLIPVRHERRLYDGATSEDAKVLREGPLMVPYEQYPFELYPDYNVGMAILLSMDALQSMVSVSRHVMYIPVEDAFLGIVAKAAGIEPHFDKGFVLFSETETDENQLAMARSTFLEGEGTAGHNLHDQVWRQLLDDRAAVHTSSPTLKKL